MRVQGRSHRHPDGCPGVPDGTARSRPRRAPQAAAARNIRCPTFGVPRSPSRAIRPGWRRETRRDRPAAANQPGHCPAAGGRPAADHRGGPRRGRDGVWALPAGPGPVAADRLSRRRLPAARRRRQNASTAPADLGTRNQFLAGGGAQAVFALTDAIYAPLAERQVLRARNLDIQTAKNDALLAVAVAYFDVQQAAASWRAPGLRRPSPRAGPPGRQLGQRTGAADRGRARPRTCWRPGAAGRHRPPGLAHQQRQVDRVFCGSIRPRSWSRWSRRTCRSP